MGIFISAIVGFILMSITVSYGNKVRNRWLRYLVAIAGIFLAFTGMGYVAMLFELSNKAVEYSTYILLAFIAIHSLFFGKK